MTEVVLHIQSPLATAGLGRAIRALVKHHASGLIIEVLCVDFHALGENLLRLLLSVDSVFI